MSRVIEFVHIPLERSEQHLGMIGKYTSSLIDTATNQQIDYLEHEIWNGLRLPQQYIQALLEMYTDIYGDEYLRDTFAYTKFRGFRSPETYLKMLKGGDSFCRYDYISLAFLPGRESHQYNGLATFTGLWPEYDDVEVAYLTVPAETRKGYAKRNTAVGLDCAHNVFNATVATADIEPANAISLKTFRSVGRLTHDGEIQLKKKNYYYQFPINPNFPVARLTEEDLYCRN